MSTQKSLKNKKTPPSQMLRVPTPLIEAVKELSRLHRQGHTDALLQSLQHLISTIDSNTAHNIDSNSSQTAKQLEERLEKLELHLNSDSNSIAKSVTNLEQKLETVTTRLLQLESALLQQLSSKNTTRRQSFNSQFPKVVELQPYTKENLGRRLGVDASTLDKERINLSPSDFQRWCRHRDPSSLAWRFNESDGLYHPITS